MVLRVFGLNLLPSGPARTIFEFAPGRVFCIAASGRHLLLRIHPAWTCFIFKKQGGLTAAKLLDLILRSSCLALPSVLSASKLPCHVAAKAFFWVAPAPGDCHQYLSLLLCPYGHELPGLRAAPHRQSERPAPLLRSARGTSPSGAGFAGGEPKEVRAPSQAPCRPPAPVTAGCLCKVMVCAC